MMLSEMIAVILAVVVFSTTVEADTEEDIELLIFNRNMSTKLTKSDVLKKLKKANLTRHGYKKEVSYQSVMSPESTPYFKESYFYYKSENCSRTQEIEEELETLIPGVFGNEVANRLKTELQYWRLDDMNQCKVGLEVVFKGVDDTYQRSKRGLGKKSKGKSKSKSGGKSKGFKTLLEKEIDKKIPIVGVKIQGKLTVKGDLIGSAVNFAKGFATGFTKTVLSGKGIQPAVLVGVGSGLIKAAKKFKVEWKSTAKSKPNLPSDKRKKVSSSRKSTAKSKPKLPSDKRKKVSSSRRRSSSYSSRRRSISYSSRRRTSYSSRRRTSYSSRRRSSSSSSSSSSGGGGGGGWWRR